MIPSSVHTILIGYDKLPPIVKHCLRRNQLLCDSEKIPFIIKTFERNYLFPTPGIQAEYEKLTIHLERGNTLVIDWDIELLDLPNLPPCQFPYLGRNEQGKNDLFLSYCSTNLCREIIEKFYSAFLNKSVINTQYINGYDFTNAYFDSTAEYPSTAYIHYKTQCGYHSINDTYSALPIKQRKKLDSHCKKLFRSGGKKWPI